MVGLAVFLQVFSFFLFFFFFFFFFFCFVQFVVKASSLFHHNVYMCWEVKLSGLSGSSPQCIGPFTIIISPSFYRMIEGDVDHNCILPSIKFRLTIRGTVGKYPDFLCSCLSRAATYTYYTWMKLHFLAFSFIFNEKCLYTKFWTFKQGIC